MRFTVVLQLSHTMQKKHKGQPKSVLKPFVKGDPRINRKGQPRKLPSLDKLLPEVLGSDDDDESKIKQILDALAERALHKGGDRAAEILMERGYGKVKEVVELDDKRERVADVFPDVPIKRGKNKKEK